MHSAALQYPAENPFTRHDAITRCPLNRATVIMALLADLGHFKHYPSIYRQTLAGLERYKIDPPRHDVLGENPVIEFRHLFTHPVDALPGQHGYLTMPIAGMRVTLDPPTLSEYDLRHTPFNNPFFTADAHRFYISHKFPPVK